MLVLTTFVFFFFLFFFSFFGFGFFFCFVLLFFFFNFGPFRKFGIIYSEIQGGASKMVAIGNYDKISTLYDVVN